MVISSTEIKLFSLDDSKRLTRVHTLSRYLSSPTIKIHAVPSSTLSSPTTIIAITSAHELITWIVESNQLHFASHHNLSPSSPNLAAEDISMTCLIPLRSVDPGNRSIEVASVSKLGIITIWTASVPDSRSSGMSWVEKASVRTSRSGAYQLACSADSISAIAIGGFDNSPRAF